MRCQERPHLLPSNGEELECLGRGTVAKHGVEDVTPSAREGDGGLLVLLALFPIVGTPMATSSTDRCASAAIGLEARHC